MAFLLIVQSGDARTQYSSRNQYAVFDGASYIAVPFSNALNGALSQGGVIAIDAWVRPTALGGFQAIVGNDQAGGYCLGVTGNGKLRFCVGGGIYRESNAVIAAGQWTHVAVQYVASTSTLAIAINNTADLTVANVGAFIGVNQGELRIGADRQGAAAADFFTGAIDEVRIWNGDLSFPSTAGALYRIPQQFATGRYGRMLVGAWRMNGDATDPVSGNDGSSVGGVQFQNGTPPPHYDRICANLVNGTGQTHDYFQVPHAPSISLTTEYTVECWVKVSPQPGGAAPFQTFVSKGSLLSSALTYWLGVDKQTNRLRFIPDGSAGGAMESTDPLPPGVWTHVAATYRWSGNSGEARVYINGLPSGTRAYATLATVNQFPLLIGTADIQAPAAQAQAFTGAIDEVRIWSVARSDAQIGNAHRLEFDGPANGLVADYHLDGDVLDASGTGNNGSNKTPPSTELHFLDASDLPAQPTLALSAPVGGESWLVGSTRQITWSSSGLSRVTILLSRDNGVSFPEMLADTLPAAIGSYPWTVTGPATSAARVRIETSGFPGYASASPSSFTIAQPQPHMEVQPSMLVFTAQVGVDPPSRSVTVLNSSGGALAWTAASPQGWIGLSPAAGGQNETIDVSVSVAGLTAGVYNGVIALAGNADNSPINIPVRLEVSAFPMYRVAGRVLLAGSGLSGVVVRLTGTIADSVTTLANGNFEFPGLPAGSYMITPVEKYYDFNPASRAISGLSAPVTDILFNAQPKQGVAMLRWRRGWNLIALPVDPDTISLSRISSSFVSPAYRYSRDSSYLEEQRLRFGVGYWVKSARDDSALITGVLRKRLSWHLTAAGNGWTLIGTTSGPVSVASLAQAPAASLVTIYQYEPGIGYRLPPGDVLQPGKGYYVKVWRDVQIGMISSLTAPDAKGPSVLPDILGLPAAPK